MLWDSGCRDDAGTGEGGSASQPQGLHLIAVERLRPRRGTGEVEGERTSGEGTLWDPPPRQEGETPEEGEERGSLKWAEKVGCGQCSQAAFPPPTWPLSFCSLPHPWRPPLGVGAQHLLFWTFTLISKSV